jgi:PBSX family phage terminase large subunit
MQKVFNHSQHHYMRNNPNAICPDVSTLSKNFTFFGATFGCVGYKIPANIENILGNNVDGILVDEATLMAHESFQHLIGRLNQPHAQLIMTSNPSGSHHYLKKDFIDKCGEVPEWMHFGFKLEDNPVVMANESYLRTIKNTYKGVFYKRYILGEWCDASGLIYPFFGEGYIKPPPCEPTEYFIGYDHGQSVGHRTCAVMIGYNCINKRIWVEKEFVTDPLDTDQFGSITDIIKAFWRWVGGYQPKVIYVDPSASAVEGLLSNNPRGVSVQHAENDVVLGITTVMRLMSTGHLTVSDECPNLIDELYKYRWNEKKSIALGRDVPLKEYDDCVDALRYAIASRFNLDSDSHTMGLHDSYVPPVQHYRTQDLYGILQTAPQATLGFGV